MGYAAQAQPAWQNYIPTWTGFSVNPALGANGASRYIIPVGRICTVNVTPNTAGTSNAPTLTVSLPFVAVSGSTFVVRICDNGAYTYSGLGVTTAGSNIATIYKDGQGTAFTASGTKNAQFQFSYEI